MHFQPFTSVAIASTMSFFFTTNAHMMMRNPVPYGKSTLNNSPLVADGSDFPCKQRPGVYDPEGASNVMAIGEPQTLNFLGSAVHGGGSCQVSLTTDLQPTKSSKWMVIKSIEGGCPANVPGNLPADAQGTDAATFQYTIPEGIAPGQYTIAWSWLNKIGNREFYMNCGPATVTASKKKRYVPTPKTSKRQASFPAMYVANLVGVNSCKTVEGEDYQYPDAGTDVQTSGEPLTLLDAACMGQSVVTPSSPNTSPEPESSSPSASQPAASSAASPGVFATGAASGSAIVPQASSTATVIPEPAASTGTASSGGSSTSSNVAGTACTDEGAWACAADGNSFQRCASGVWSVSMAMAQGTNCTPGTSDNLSMGSKKFKRHISHLRHSHNRYD